MSDEVRMNGNDFIAFLFLIFLVLRLTDQIDWAWYWVASPLLIFVALVVFIMLVKIVALVVRKHRAKNEL